MDEVIIDNIDVTECNCRQVIQDADSGKMIQTCIRYCDSACSPKEHKCSFYVSFLKNTLQELIKTLDKII